MTRTAWKLGVLLSLMTCAATRGSQSRTVQIPAGSYVPLFAEHGRSTRVQAFRMDVRPVTRREYAAFVATHAEWRRSAVRMNGYLADWPSDSSFGDRTDAERPVTNVTRAAAAAYCSAQGKRLPSLDEWEYAAGASRTQRNGANDPGFRQMLLSLYTRARPSRPERVGTGFTNAFGVSDMHGRVWEWVSAGHHMNMRMPDGKPHDLNCAGAANGAADPTSFAAFLRYAYRSGLNDSSTGSNLGFRCAGPA